VRCLSIERTRLVELVDDQPRLDPSTMEKLTAIAALLVPAERARLRSSPEAIEPRRVRISHRRSRARP
jgi:hypothetical protein